MEHKLNSLTEDEILNLDPQQLETHLEEIKNINEAVRVMAFTIVGKRIMDIIYGYDIGSVGINPHYEYNDEGFSGTYMITIDGEDVCYKDDENVPRYSKQAEEISYTALQEKIDNELADLRFLIQEDMHFNAKELNKLKVKSSYYQLEKDVPVVKEKSKVSNSRYKL